METQEITYHVRLLAEQEDGLGYTVYVFENLDWSSLEDHYIMCVRYPNWDQAVFNIEDIGYVRVRYVKEGQSSWYNGNEMVKYKYTDIIFLKFIHEKANIEIDKIKLD